MPTARIVVDPAHTVGPLSRRLFGSVVEHLGRCVYNGIYEPAHPSADLDGFRTDVMGLVRELGVTTIRYPGVAITEERSVSRPIFTNMP